MSDLQGQSVGITEAVCENSRDSLWELLGQSVGITGTVYGRELQGQSVGFTETVCGNYRDSLWELQGQSVGITGAVYRNCSVNTQTLVPACFFYLRNLLHYKIILENK